MMTSDVHHSDNHCCSSLEVGLLTEQSPPPRPRASSPVTMAVESQVGLVVMSKINKYRCKRFSLDKDINSSFSMVQNEEISMRSFIWHVTLYKVVNYRPINRYRSSWFFELSVSADTEKMRYRSSSKCHTRHLLRTTPDTWVCLGLYIR